MTLRHRAYVVESDESSAIDGKSKQSAINAIYKVQGNTFRGIFRDEYWTPVNKFFKDLSTAGINHYIDKTEYRKDENGTPNAKAWDLVFEFKNDKGKPAVIHGKIIAAGAGSQKDPLDAYDLVLTMG
jgi:hypothetical protein